jgi:HAD superfamily hydrolase (TIGR01549 family)
VQALIFDFDGTLVDSDEALLLPFDSLGIDRADVVMGSAVAEECDRLGIPMETYVDLYDDESVEPFPGVAEVIPKLSRWALCSNKHPRSGAAELARLAWEPEIALFADHFGWAHKGIGPVLELMGLEAGDVVMVGDSDGDVRCADEVGCAFAWAGWNPRVRERSPTGTVLDEPSDLLDLFG